MTLGQLVTGNSSSLCHQIYVLSRGKKPPNLFLHLRTIPSKAVAARLDKATMRGTQRVRRGEKIEGDRGRGRAITQEPRPGGEVAKIEKRVLAAKPDLLGEDWRVRCAGAAGDYGAGIAEDGGA